MDPELQHLLADALTWAEGRGRVLDVELLQLLLDLHLEFDGLGDAQWPPCSAEHLVAELLPARGPVELPTGDDVVATLDSYWRFLRSTGRMASGSASPAALRQEARGARARLRRAGEQQLAARRALQSVVQEERRQASPAPAAASVAHFRSSALWRRLGLLLDWVRQGQQHRRPVDAEHELEVDLVRDLYQAAGLDEWTGRHLALSLEKEGAEGLGRGARWSLEPWHEDWQEQADCLAVVRLWWVALRSGLLAVRDARAEVVFVEPEDVRGWRLLAVDVAASLAEWASFQVSIDGLEMVLVRVAGPGGEPRTVTELVQEWVELVQLDLEELGIDPSPGAGGEPGLLDDAGWDLVQALALFDDAGLWTRSTRLSGTELGWDLLLRMRQQDEQAQEVLG
ncbi:hypothetical protein [Luteococcus sp.]|uniref:hypothetical protein n=1 Tax=Luteococcus sp. TaxID=1969402 RepID=UPI003735426B